MTTESVQKKLDALTATGWPIAFDGCHKLYFLEDDERRAEARAAEYEIHDAADLHALYEGSSCGLRFVSCWAMGDESWDHPLNVEQFEDQGEAAS